jgi:hypothetical protein
MACWKRRIAARVSGPNTPSVGLGSYPSCRRTACTCRRAAADIAASAGSVVAAAAGAIAVGAGGDEWGAAEVVVTPGARGFANGGGCAALGPDLSTVDVGGGVGGEASGVGAGSGAAAGGVVADRAAAIGAGGADDVAPVDDGAVGAADLPIPGADHSGTTGGRSPLKSESAR